MTSPIGSNQTPNFPASSATASTGQLVAQGDKSSGKTPYFPAADVVAKLTPGERSALARMTTNVNARGTDKDKANLATLKLDLHAREMSKLSSDVYGVSTNYKTEKGQPIPPPEGWTRASASPATLKEYKLRASDLNPGGRSGFRAELYIPDKNILGPNAKPVLVFKGTTASSIEDWANNFGQGVSGKADYYTRAMRVTDRLQATIGTNFEVSGHSLGGGMASAAASLAGVSGTTFNSAGLHKNTVQNYLSNTGSKGAPVDPSKLVRAYQVEGEVLTTLQTATKSLTPDNAQTITGTIKGGLNAALAVNKAANDLSGVPLPIVQRVRGLIPEDIKKVSVEVQRLNAAGKFEGIKAATSEDLINLPTAAGTPVFLQALTQTKAARPPSYTADSAGKMLNKEAKISRAIVAQRSKDYDVLPITDVDNKLGAAVGTVEALLRLKGLFQADPSATGMSAQTSEMVARHAMTVVGIGIDARVGGFNKALANFR